MNVPVFEKLRCQYHNLLMFIKDEGLKSAFNQAIYLNDEFIVVERDLSKPPPTFRRNFDLRIVTLEKRNLDEVKNYKFARKVRELKCLSYLKKGYNVFLGVQNTTVIAEQYWISTEQIKANTIHPDLKWMKREIQDNEIFAFELFTSPDYRGTPATNIFLSSYFKELVRLGYAKIFGFFPRNNIPSMWLHRMFSFEETNRVKAHRFLFFHMINGKFLCK